MKRMAILLFAAAALIAFVGSSAMAGGVLKLAGSTTNQLGYVEPSKAAFEAKTGIKLDIAGGGTGAGMKAAIAGKVDIGMASRPLSEKELGSGLIPYVVGYDAIAVIVNKANPVENLTMEQLKGINTGAITNWKEVGGPDKPILVVTSHSGSATRKMFKKIVLGGEEYVEKALKVNTTRAEVDKVEKFPMAIGAVSTSFVDPSRVKIVTVDGVAPTEENLLSGAYRISRPLILTTLGEAKGDARTYIDYVLSPEGQAFVTEKFVGVNGSR